MDNIKDQLVYNVKISFEKDGGIFTVEKKAVKFEEAYETVKKLVEDNPDNEKLQRAWCNGDQKSFGTSSTSHGNFEYDVDAYIPREKGTETHTCPRGVEGTLSIQLEMSQKATWDKIGKTRVCSYCGSIHPDDFYEMIKKCIETDAEEVEISGSDKGYKYYARYTNVQNASQGGIKFYTQHAFVDPFGEGYVAKVNNIVRKALEVSSLKYTRKLNEMKKGLEGTK